MYASIRKYYIIPRTAEEFMQRVQQGFVPSASLTRKPELRSRCSEQPTGLPRISARLYKVCQRFRWGT